MRKRIYIVGGAVAAGVLAVASVVGVSAQTGDSTGTPTPTSTATATATATSDTSEDGPLNHALETLAENLSITPEELRAALEETGTELIDEAVADGRLTAEQGERLKERLAEGDRFFFGPFGHLGKFDRDDLRGAHREGIFHGLHAVFGEGLDAVAGIIGIDRETLLEELRSGKTLAEVADDHGVSRDDLKAGLSQQFDELLDTLIDQPLPEVLRGMLDHK
jgi:uncharacterized protein (DUF433 family)